MARLSSAKFQGLLIWGILVSGLMKIESLDFRDYLKNEWHPCIHI
jgi:hypothetical protein